MKKCENCNCEHTGSYGSGRFCSCKCSRGFSTKAKRKEINEKVSKKLTKEKIERICKICGKTFKPKKISSDRKYCGTCTFKSPEYRENASKIRIENILSGKVEKFGKSKKCIYEFKNTNIKCDSKLEYFGIEYAIEKYNPEKITRCNFYIDYVDFLGEKRKFIPDFIIFTENSIIIMECKYDKLYYKLNEKWQNYIENSIIKKKVLEEYCKKQSYEILWFTNKTGKKYKHR